MYICKFPQADLLYEKPLPDFAVQVVLKYSTKEETMTSYFKQPQECLNTAARVNDKAVFFSQKDMIVQTHLICFSLPYDS